MNKSDHIANRRNDLKKIIKNGFENALQHTKGFVSRILGNRDFYVGKIETTTPLILDSVRYGGFPDVAYFGFLIGSQIIDNLDEGLIQGFKLGLTRLMERQETKLDEFLSDDIAVLGVTDGLVKLNARSELQNYLDWLMSHLARYSSGAIWTNRARELASDMLDSRGRLQTKVGSHTADEIALDLALRETWPAYFSSAPILGMNERQQLLGKLLFEPLPAKDDIEKASIWLCAINSLLNDTVSEILPKVSDTARLLRNTQHGFERWVWDETTRNGRVAPARWLIDNEYHVQSYLWAVLYPLYGQDFVYEQYLPGYGQLQPRVDLGILSIKLIIEVKIARTPSDFKKIEEQIAGDLGIYFSDPERFDTMLVYVYDDCDTHKPELYASLENALKKRDGRIEDVIIIRRPSMIPNRNDRK